ncbi:LysM peptidoglycan-binding domain-containing protein [Pseudoxanthomonas indica]|uniref:LysM domain-containing protein n=1 Tax=Pseudoxanthomonas indica TaxID=428993 RepID=A0A1T5KDK0_9GAMM|nr:LysM peptidoglycan-binding domain-containing protein [Pseudoxanthomonas indica]GGD48706.1 peptidoglycan-binding protein LysM [Pseudoxanthomonas indica]SKC61812.1 LysM domain-containing protein [Pseudoxanthomonas indica]
MFKSFRTVLAVAAFTVGSYAVAADLSGSHPDTYVVKRGDTLWDISAKFLKKPWLWPEIWQANPQIKNPHLIYPGDVLSLAYLDRVAVQAGPREEQPLNAIPLSDVEPFLKNLSVADSFRELPYVAGLEENQLRATAGQLVYVLGLDQAQVGERYAVVRPTQRYTQTHVNSSGEYLTYSEDLDFRGRRIKGAPAGGLDSLWNSSALADGGPVELLGYELEQVNVGTVTRGLVPGTETISLTLQDSGKEVRVGDRIVPVQAKPYDLQFFPHAPSVGISEGKLQIAAVASALVAGGPRDVVAISGGSREGLDNGTVLSIWRQGSHVNNDVRWPNSSRLDDQPRSGAGRVSLPDEYVGHVMIFRTFEKVSYGLVMEGIKPSHVGYELKHPDATY